MNCESSDLELVNGYSDSPLIKLPNTYRAFTALFALLIHAAKGRRAYNLDELISKQSDGRDRSMGIKGGAYFPKNGFTTSFPLEIYVKFLEQYPKRSSFANLDMDIGFCYLSLQSAEKTNINQAGAITGKSEITWLSLPLSLMATIKPYYFEKARFQAGFSISGNYAKLERQIDGSGQYAFLSGLSNKDSALFFGYSVKGAALHKILKGFNILLEGRYSVARTGFSIYKASDSGSVKEKTVHNMSGGFAGVGVEYGF